MEYSLFYLKASCTWQLSTHPSWGLLYLSSPTWQCILVSTSNSSLLYYICTYVLYCRSLAQHIVKQASSLKILLSDSLPYLHTIRQCTLGLLIYYFTTSTFYGYTYFLFFTYLSSHINSTIFTLTYLFTHHSVTYDLIHLLPYSLTHGLIHSLTMTLFTFIYSLIRPLTKASRHIKPVHPSASSDDFLLS